MYSILCERNGNTLPNLYNTLVTRCNWNHIRFKLRQSLSCRKQVKDGHQLTWQNALGRRGKMICQARLSPLSAGADSKAGKVAMSAFASLASTFLLAALCKAAASALCCLAATLAACKHAAVKSCYEGALEASFRR